MPSHSHADARSEGNARFQTHLLVLRAKRPWVRDEPTSTLLQSRGTEMCSTHAHTCALTCVSFWTPRCHTGTDKSLRAGFDVGCSVPHQNQSRDDVPDDVMSTVTTTERF